MKRVLTLQEDLRRGQINPKLRILFHAGHFSTVTAARFFNLVRPPIIIIETGQSARCIYAYIHVYVHVYTCIYTCYTYIVAVWEAQSRENPSHSVTSAEEPRAHLHTEIGLYTHLHTHRSELYIRRREIYHGKIGLHTQRNAMARFTHFQKEEACNVLCWWGAASV